MKLSLDHIEAYLRLAMPDHDDAAIAESARKCRASIEAGQRDPGCTRLLTDAEGTPVAALRLQHLSGESWTMSPIYDGTQGPPDEALTQPMLDEAMAVALRRGATEISCRVPLGRMSGAYRAALIGAGFEHIGRRVEFKLEVEALPGELGTPLVWKTMPEVGEQVTAEIFGRAARGAPDWDEDRDDPAALIPLYLQEEGLTSDPACVQIGHLDGEPVAFVTAQVEASSGWSRITYMGLVEEARGKGLGKWVHRHGFELLRAQGGALYHGGTAMDNLAMRRLFEQHGCRPTAELDEWIWRRGELSRSSA